MYKTTDIRSIGNHYNLHGGVELRVEFHNLNYTIFIFISEFLFKEIVNFKEKIYDYVIEKLNRTSDKLQPAE